MTKNTRAPEPPVAPKRPFKDTRHEIERVDDYAWLRAENWQEVMRDPSVLDADIRANLDAENAYTAAVMASRYRAALLASLQRQQEARHLHLHLLR